MHIHDTIIKSCKICFHKYPLDKPLELLPCSGNKVFFYIYFDYTIDINMYRVHTYTCTQHEIQHTNIPETLIPPLPHLCSNMYVVIRFTSAFENNPLNTCEQILSSCSSEMHIFIHLFVSDVQFH